MEEIIFNVSLYMGIAGFLMFVFSFLSGLRIIKIKGQYRLHKRIGVLGFCLVSVHAFVMSYYYFFS